MATVGNEIIASTSGIGTAGVTVIMNDLIFTDGVVFAYSVYFRSEKPVRFQMWRPVSNETNEFQLVGETRVIPSLKNGREDVSIRKQLVIVEDSKLPKHNTIASLYYSTGLFMCTDLNNA